jgi:hypothetical protein
MNRNMDSAVFILIMEPVALADGSLRCVQAGMVVKADNLPRNAQEWLREGVVLAWLRRR